MEKIAEIIMWLMSVITTVSVVATLTSFLAKRQRPAPGTVKIEVEEWNAERGELSLKIELTAEQFERLGEWAEAEGMTMEELVNQLAEKAFRGNGYEDAVASTRIERHSKGE